MLGLTCKARLWKTKRLRLRLFCTGAQLVTTSPRGILRVAAHWLWTDVITAALTRLEALPCPG